MTIPWWWKEDPAKLEAERETARLIQRFLRQPPKPRITLSNHTPWDAREQVCRGCGKSLLDLHAHPTMPPCVTIQERSAGSGK